MKQLVQYLKSGKTAVIEAPAPVVSPGRVIVQTAFSAVSPGTERMVVDFAEKNLVEKARARPDLVRQTLVKAQQEGALATFDAVQNRLDQPLALGYSSAGTVIDVADDVSDIKLGDRVACAGGGYAVHAEVVSVPKNLVVKLQDEVDFEPAAFTTLAAIALQGIRLAEVKLGEIVAVIGLGLLGQLTVQMLRAAGCIVVAMDIQPDRAALAQQSGANVVTADSDDLKSLCAKLTDGHGVDAVLITADTKSNQPVEIAGEIARKKGIVVAVGAVGMHIPRKMYYEKELDFRISSSYGPGRYDPAYEEKGRDYPYAFVRWTEQRNMQAFVQMLADGQVNVEPLITHRFPIEEADQAYNLITGKTEDSFLGVLLSYPDQPDIRYKIILHPEELAGATIAEEQIHLGVLGAGNFANATLLPILKGVSHIELDGICSAGGVSARTTADRFDFRYCTSTASEILGDPAVNTLAILTRHDRHAEQVIAGLVAGKHLFVEKPLCLNQEELERIVQVYEHTRVQDHPPQLMVGFNRRFAPFIVELRQHLTNVSEPLMLHYRVNAGYIPQDHWTQDPVQGGGRLLGEGVHFLDLLMYLADEAPLRVTTTMLPDSGRYCQDNFVVTIEFANGSVGMVTYLANGDKGCDKEMLEVFGGGLAAQMNNFRTLQIYHGKKTIKRAARLRQDKGHRAEWIAWRDFLLGRSENPMPFHDIVLSTQTSLAAYQSSRENRPVLVGTTPPESVQELD